MTSAWGVDPSTQRVSVARAPDAAVLTRSFRTDLRDGQRAAHIYLETWSLGCDMLERHGRPRLVLVEQPFGKVVEPVLYMAIGAMLGALWRLVNRGDGPLVAVELVRPSSWKAAALGRGMGGASKKDPAGYPVLRWARERGYAGSLDDEADALGIAECAWQRLVRAAA